MLNSGHLIASRTVVFGEFGFNDDLLLVLDKSIASGEHEELRRQAQKDRRDKVVRVRQNVLVVSLKRILHRCISCRELRPH